MPQKLRERFISRSDKIKRITIYSKHDLLPWEMLYPFNDDPPFDAGKFLVEQVEICRWINPGLPPKGISVSRADFVVSDEVELAKAREEVDKIASLLSSWDQTLRSTQLETADDLFELFKNKTISMLHLACHQSFDDKIGRILLKNRPISPKHFVGYRDAAAFVFMNVCRSDRKVPGYNEIGGWANSFLEAGASVFLGTLYKVRDETAAVFAQRLYEQLFVENKPFGEALRCARMHVKKDVPADPTWLAYSFYGDADARIRRG